MKKLSTTTAVLAVVVLVAFGFALAAASPASAGPTGNLLENPGAETGNFTGWNHGGAAVVLDEIEESCGTVYPNSGDYFFSMGPDGTVTPAWMEQEIDLTAHGGTPGTFVASGMVQTEKYWGPNTGWPDPATDPENYDRGKLIVTFLNSTDAQIGQFIVDPVENPCCEEPAPEPTFTPVPHEYAQFSVTDNVPVGAVKALYRLEGHRIQSVYINVFFDDLFFELDVSVQATPTPTPTPSPTPMRTPTPTPTPTVEPTYPPPVGGQVLPTNMLTLVTPWLVAGALIVVATVSLAVWNRKQKREGVSDR